MPFDGRVFGVGPFHWRSRKLTNQEMCRLQTFPDDVGFDCGSSDTQKMLGNAVPSLLAEMLAREIRRQLLGGRRDPGGFTLMPPARRSIPESEPVAPVPVHYRELIGDHPDHPRKGRLLGKRRSSARHRTRIARRTRRLLRSSWRISSSRQPMAVSPPNPACDAIIEHFVDIIIDTSYYDAVTNQKTSTYSVALQEARAGFTDATARLRKAEAEVARASAEITKLRRTITALSALCSVDPLWDDLGITEACFEVMKEARGAMSTSDVVEGVEAIGFDIKAQKNANASVHTVLMRLVKKGNISRENTTDGVVWKGPNFDPKYVDIPF